MKERLEQLIEERNQLFNKVTSLEQFIDAPAYGELSLREQKLVIRQSLCMDVYLSTLNKRIELLNQEISKV